jgi:hypothetical protein
MAKNVAIQRRPRRPLGPHGQQALRQTRQRLGKDLGMAESMSELRRGELTFPVRPQDPVTASQSFLHGFPQTSATWSRRASMS